MSTEIPEQPASNPPPAADIQAVADVKKPGISITWIAIGILALTAVIAVPASAGVIYLMERSKIKSQPALKTIEPNIEAWKAQMRATGNGDEVDEFERLEREKAGKAAGGE